MSEKHSLMRIFAVDMTILSSHKKEKKNKELNFFLTRLSFVALQPEMVLIFAMLWQAAGSPCCVQGSQSPQQGTAVAARANCLPFATCNVPPVPEMRQRSCVSVFL